MTGYLLEKVLQDQSGRETRIGKLGGAIVVIDEIDPSGRSVPHFPAGGQGSGHGQIAQIPGNARIVPRADPSRHVVEVDLTLLRLPHFVTCKFNPQLNSFIVNFKLIVSTFWEIRSWSSIHLLCRRRSNLLLLSLLAHGSSPEGSVGIGYCFRAVGRHHRGSNVSFIAFPTIPKTLKINSYPTLISRSLQLLGFLTNFFIDNQFIHF